jgi:hypothetical protein
VPARNELKAKNQEIRAVEKGKDKIEAAITAIKPFLLDLRNRIRESSGDRGFGWTRGGCFAFAAAARRCGAEIGVVAEWCEDANDWAPHHAFLMVVDHLYDATGRHTPRAMLRRYERMTGKSLRLGAVKGWSDLWWPEQEYVKESEIRQIAKQLRGNGLSIPKSAASKK